MKFPYSLYIILFSSLPCANWQYPKEKRKTKGTLSSMVPWYPPPPSPCLDSSCSWLLVSAGTGDGGQQC